MAKLDADVETPAAGYGIRIMSAEAKKQYGMTVALLLLGALALYGGKAWLALVIPAAALIWLAAGTGLHRNRN